MSKEDRIAKSQKTVKIKKKETKPKTQFVSDNGDIKQKKSKTKHFNKVGALVKTEKEAVYAKVLTNTSGSITYLIKCFQKQPFDPSGPYKAREKFIETKFEKVSKTVFDYYMMYLQTNNSIYMTKAQRRIINE